MRRENEIFSVLSNLIEQELDFILVGGYAVTGLGRHRFSVDCDLVLPKRELSEAEKILERFEFARDIEKSGFDSTYGGEFARFLKKVGGLPVTFDLLVKSLVCRSTEASWSFEYIMAHSAHVMVGGIEKSVRCRVPERELMVAFKVHSARRTDVRDIVMLIEDLDSDKVLSHLRRGKLNLLKKQMNNICEMLNDERLVDSLKGVFTLTSDVEKQIRDARKKIEILSKELTILQPRS